METPSDIRRKIQQFDRDYAVDLSRMNARRPGIESLADGWYTCRVTSAELAEVGDNGQPILRMVLFVEDIGSEIEHVYWLTSQVSCNILGQDLCTLKYDAAAWKGPDRPFSAELVKLVASGDLVGHCFQAQKKMDAKPGQKAYPRLYINWPLGKGKGPAVATRPHRQPATTTQRPAAQPTQQAPADNGQELFDQAANAGADVPWSPGANGW
jgi:hypothetical protein